MSLDLYECLSLSEGSRAAGQPRVDRDKGIIFNVKALGWKSQNGREYLPEGVSTALYEGRRVCVGHVRTPGDRDPHDTYGLLEGVSKQPDGVYAERLQLLNPAGEFEQRLLTAADRYPHLFGLSHSAHGNERAGSGGKIIESVDRVESVDLVCDPATVISFYESRNPAVKKKLRDLAESLKASRPRYARTLLEVAEAGIMSPDAEMAPPAEAPPDEAKDHKAALMDALKALCDEADTLDEGELMKKFKAILKLIKGDAGGGETGGSSEGGGESAAEESRRRQSDANLREQVATLTAEKLIRKAAGKANVSLSESLVEALARPGMTEQRAAEVVNELRATGTGGQKPRSAAPVTPAAGNKDVRESKAPSDDDLKTLGARIAGNGR